MAEVTTMSMDSRRLHLRFSMLKPEQQQAYEIITSTPAGQRMEFLCGLLNRHRQYDNLPAWEASAPDSTARAVFNVSAMLA